jgi:predicted nucleic acid-binding protein
VSFLLDTNIVSEIARPRPERAVLDWFEIAADAQLYLSVLSLGEIRKGVDRLPAGARRRRLTAWLEGELPAWFGTRLLPIDGAVADRWGRILAASARPLPAIDSLLAATALVHGLALVTRNVADFQIDGLEVVDPWRHGL